LSVYIGSAFSTARAVKEDPLSQDTVTAESIEIPGELRLSNPIPPPVLVRLPLVVRPQRFKNFLLGLLALPIGALFSFSFIAMVFGAHEISLTGFNCFLFLVILPLSLFVGVGFTGAALTCFWDALRGRPVLEVGVDGLRDRRSGVSVPWSSIQCATNFLGGSRSVDLQLRYPVTSWQNPFRVGVFLHRYRSKPDHVLVSVAYLDVSAHVLLYTILTLVEWNGGKAISKTSGSFDMGLKVLPRGRG
jgi:hypothetical protein